MPKKALSADRLRLGACYYPEQWPHEIWDEDFKRMAEMGLSIVRMGEFAWSVMEPSEGQFTFEFFTRAMDAAHEHGIKVILGTPTATPPAWLTHKYPEVLNATREGVVFRHGQRRHYNYSAPIYRELSERIAGKMAEAYHEHPALVGWQIDNELNCEVSVFYSDADQTAFRRWLKARYGNLDELNRAWGALFWNQTYSDWEQIRLTSPAPSYSPNPHQALDEKRFISDSAISFAKLQADAIRRVDRKHFITTQGPFPNIDFHRLTGEALDFLSFDSYPSFAYIDPEPGGDALLDRANGLQLSMIRDASPNFCVMEQQSGPGGWVNRIEQPTPRPGQLRLWTFQSIAHGADLLLYYRWRTAPFGTEIYWHGINDHHNVPNRRCEEAQRVCEEAARLEGLAGSTYKAEVGILRDYDNEWDGDLDTWHGPYDAQSVKAWFGALQRRHVPLDIVYIDQGLTAKELLRYHCLIYPHPAILSDETALILREYADQGGTIVFGCRTGYKDRRGHCPMRPYPGPVADLCGVTVQEFTRVPKGQQVKLHLMDVGSLDSGPFNEVLQPNGSTVLGRFGEGAGHYAGSPAVVWNAWGMGSAYYFGGVFTQATAGAIADRIGLESPLRNLVMPPPDVELAIREKDGERFVFLLNYATTDQVVDLRRPLHDLLSDTDVAGRVAIEPYGVIVFKLERS